ncbi:MAG: HAMP domain-containing protein [Acidobacteria bacterium]|nr:HAMP domain-containing protein [Acidobacteriota bacterium]
MKIGVLAAFVPALVYGLSRFTHHLLAAPLRRLQEGIQSVEDGHLQPMQVSRTGDEVEYLGHQFNRMIARLQTAEAEVRGHQQMLEERIRQRTEALEEATHRAMAANRAKSEFLANISHELRTPMNGVLGMLDIVLDDGVAEPQREQLEIAKGCAHSLLALLNNLLDLSKIEAGKMILEQIAFDVRIVAEDSTRTMQAKACEKRLELGFMSDPAVPERVLGDPLRFRQIVTIC